MDICSEGSKLLEGPTGEKGLGVRRGQHRGKEAVNNGGSWLWTSFNNGALLCGGSGFLSKHFCSQGSSLPAFPAGCLLTAHSSPLPGSALQTSHSSIQPLSAVVDTLPGWVGRAGVSTLYTRLTLSCCHRLLPCSFPTEDEAPLLSQLGSPSEGLPQIWRPLLSSDPPRVAGPIPLPFLFFFLLLSFALPSSAGIFLVLLDFKGPLLVFSWAL